MTDARRRAASVLAIALTDELLSASQRALAAGLYETAYGADGNPTHATVLLASLLHDAPVPAVQHRVLRPSNAPVVARVHALPSG